MARPPGSDQAPAMSASAKAALRLELRAALGRLGAAERAAASIAASTRLRAQPLWQSAAIILFYAARSDELDLLALIEEALAVGKTVALPRYRPDLLGYETACIQDFHRDTHPGRFGIAEPVPDCPPLPLKQLDLTLVPGLCFDTTGRRLGRGQGFYDRLLGSVGGVRCGAAFDLQLRRRIPAQAHDIRMDCILTPTRWLSISPRPVRK
jgi:5-formyltetrahydrofolate cyclo-ligase